MLGVSIDKVGQPKGGNGRCPTRLTEHKARLVALRRLSPKSFSPCVPCSDGASACVVSPRWRRSRSQSRPRSDTPAIRDPIRATNRVISKRQQSSQQSDQQSNQDLTEQLTEVTISAAEMHSLDQFTPTGSRLGLSIQELPATLDVITSDEMLGRGFSSVEEAADSQAGVVSGGSPGDLEQFSMRGFTGDEITELRNGLYIGPEDMVGRPENTFNVASVEILQGPASVLFGRGLWVGP